MRSKHVIKNTAWELGYYIIVVLTGFLAPRYIILTYGSEVNGLTSTITQILNVILLLQAGMITAAVYSMYKPVADSDKQEVARLIASANRSFQRISFFFLAIMLVAAFVTAYTIHSELDSVYILIAFLIMGIRSFFDLLLTSRFRIVFLVYQKKYIFSIATLISQVISYVLIFLTLFLKLHFILMYSCFLVGSIARIVYLQFMYRRTFADLPVYKGIVYSKIPGRNYSLANEVSHSFISASIIILLSFMYGLNEASIYAVYAIVFTAINLTSIALSSSFAPSFGNLVAKGNIHRTRAVFGIFRYVFLMINTFMMMCMLYLYLPFVKMYTSGADEVNYVDLTLATLITIIGITSAFRVPYNIVVSSYGLFKETWVQPVVTVVMAFAISVILGSIQYQFILFGSIFFYAVNFVYQHFKLKKLVPGLIDEDVFITLGISTAGLVGTFFLCREMEIADGIGAWLVSAVGFAVAAIFFLMVASVIFQRKQLAEALKYAKGLMQRWSVRDV